MLKRSPSRLKRKPVEDIELPAQRQIELRRAESAQGVVSQVSLARGGNAECRCVDDLASRCVSENGTREGALLIGGTLVVYVKSAPTPK